MSKAKDYLTTKNPLRAILVFCLPMVLGSMFQQFYSLADSAIVGRFVGEGALAAVGASASLSSVLLFIAIGGGVGSSVWVGKYFGAGDYKRARASINTSIIFFVAVGVVLASIMRIFSYPLMQLLNTPEDILGVSVNYLDIYLYGLPLLFLYNVVTAMFNALGRSRIPLFFLIFSSLLNVGLDLYAVIGLNLGVEGAAWATFIAQGLSAVLSLFVLLREIKKLSPDKGRIFDKAELKPMIKLAIPSIIQQTTVSIGLLLVQVVVNGFGSEAMAGFTASSRISSVCIVPMTAIGNATSAYVAQNLGAGRADRIKAGYKASNLIVVAFAFLIGAVLELFPRELMGLFISAEDATLTAMNTGVGYLTFIGWFFCFMGFKQTADGVLKGSGDTVVFTVANFINQGVRVLLPFLLAKVVGIAIVWYVVPVGWIINTLISHIRYKSGKWKNKLV
ncbi:MAG: MATE family efflux transporter [Clostridia bacterium]|nr:MATE family efflux transporter [Clostridia bacterium]